MARRLQTVYSYNKFSFIYGLVSHDLINLDDANSTRFAKHYLYVANYKTHIFYIIKLPGGQIIASE
jgi:hypothetical protein